jgi:phage RecT family recombinase
MAGELIIKELIDKHRQEIVQRLPSFLNPSQFFALAYALENNPKLKAAAQRTPDNLLGAIFKAADLGLSIGSAHDHCTLIAYGDDIQLSIMYHGLIYLLKRAGAVLMINAACVYDGDHYKVKLGDDEGIEHEPNLDDDRRREKAWLHDKKNIKGAYAVAWLPDPLRRLKQHRWLYPGDIEAARLKSKVPDGPAWKNEYPAMAIKTAIRRVCKLIEVCGPTEENKEAWERYGRTIEVEKSESRDFEDDEPDADMPGVSAVNTAITRRANAASGRRAEGGGVKTAPPPPQNGEAKKAASPPPPSPEPAAAPINDEPISEDMQDKLADLAKLTGIKLTGLIRHIRDKYGVASLDALKSSQATEVEKYLKSAS